MTGASAGIGAEFARQLKARGYSLLLIARREDRLRALADDVLVADLANEAECVRCAEEIARREPSLLVNNAGFGTSGMFHQAEFEKQIEMHQLHVMAVTRLTRAVLPAMVRANAGAIINVASVAGFSRSAGNVSYCATKAWMVAFTEGLNLEMRAVAPSVVVQALCPGFTYSEFHDVMAMDRSRIAKSLWLPAERVVRESLDALASGRMTVVPDWRYRWF
ncbi:MAG: SDR family NAD(P)-dependent oxidoreductase, partial [Bryobacteraceae bacterium]